MKAIFLKRKKREFKPKSSYITIRPLSYIKNKNKVLTKEDYKKSIKKLKQLEKFCVKEYESSLDCFECSDEFVFRMLIRYIFYHNTKTYKLDKKVEKDEMASLLENYEEPFITYIDDVLERSSAAVRIQQNWRRYFNNKKQKESIYEKMKKTRAAMRIQRFYRDRIFYHRLSFQRNLSNQINLFKSNSFYLHKSIYHNILDLTSQLKKISLYQGLVLFQAHSAQRKSFQLRWAMEKDVFSPDIREKIFGTSQS